MAFRCVVLILRYSDEKIHHTLIRQVPPGSRKASLVDSALAGCPGLVVVGAAGALAPSFIHIVAHCG